MNLYKIWKEINWERIVAVIGITLGLLVVFYFWSIATMWSLSWIWQNIDNLAWVFGVYLVWILVFLGIAKIFVVYMMKENPNDNS